ncbi:HET-domain-containing protein, partial [Setomelanomma holmii]
MDFKCINQRDNSERSHQVAIMKHIYARAYRVLIYAGESVEGSTNLLEYISDTQQPRHRYVTPTPSHALTKIGVKKAVCDFLSRPWFRRVWVIQEAFLAQRAKFIVGEKEIDWFMLSLERLEELGLKCHLEKGMIPGIFEWMARRHSGDIDLFFALTSTRHCLAADPRDKIFALFGLLSNPSGVSFEVDYSLAVGDVFTLAAMHLVTSRNSLELLSHAADWHADSSIPSWVPDWS